MGPRGLGPIKQKVVDHHHHQHHHHHHHPDHDHHHHGHDHDQNDPGPGAQAGTQKKAPGVRPGPALFFWVPAWAPGHGSSWS